MTAVNAPDTTRREGFAYQPPLDGLRAFAVLAVMLYHAKAGWFPGGYLGVDAFFVLSGYLITSLMLVEMRSGGRLDRKAFWLRRARRLLPALFLVLIAVAAYAAFAATSAQVKSLRGDGIATLFYVANWRQVYLHHSYFDLFAVPSMLQHTWSLAVEEQWYLLWPLLLPFLVKRSGARPARLLVLIGALAATSGLLMAALYHPGHDPSRVYYGTDTRAQSLLIGAALAVLMLWRPGPRTSRGRMSLQVAGLASAGFLGVLWTQVTDTSRFLYTGGFFLEALAVALVIAAAAQPGRRLLRDLLSLAPLRWIGWISYGLYLWHWPVFVYLNSQRTGLTGTPLLLERFGVTFAISTVSYLLVEMPIRRGALRRRPQLSHILVPATVALVAAALLVGTSDIGGLGARRASAARSQDVVNVSKAALARRQAQEQTLVQQNKAVTALFVGDSRAQSIAESYGPQVGLPNLAVQSVAKLGCGISVGSVMGGGTTFGQQDCSDWQARWRYGVELFHPAVTVVLIGTWDIFDRVVNGQPINFGTPQSVAYIDSQLDQALSILTEFGAPVVLLQAPCTSMPGPFGWNEVLGRWNAIQRAWAATHLATVRLVDLNAYVCPLSKWSTKLNGAPVLPDGMHFSQASGDLVWQWLGPQVLHLAQTYHAPTTAGTTSPGTTPRPTSPPPTSAQRTR